MVGHCVVLVSGQEQTDRPTLFSGQCSDALHGFTAIHWQTRCVCVFVDEMWVESEARKMTHGPFWKEKAHTHTNGNQKSMRRRMARANLAICFHVTFRSRCSTLMGKVSGRQNAEEDRKDSRNKRRWATLTAKQTISADFRLTREERKQSRKHRNIRDSSWKNVSHGKGKFVQLIIWWDAKMNVANGPEKPARRRTKKHCSMIFATKSIKTDQIQKNQDGWKVLIPCSESLIKIPLPYIRRMKTDHKNNEKVN